LQLALSLSTKPCEECLAEFHPRVSTQRFCAESCRAKAERRRGNKRKPSRRVDRVCDQCGRVYLGQSRQRFCRSRCATAFYAGRSVAVRSRVCRVCGGMFEPLEKRGHTKICSDGCRIEWRRTYGRSFYAATKARERNGPGSVCRCGACGNEFARAGTNQRYCLDELCRLAAARAASGHYGPRRVPEILQLLRESGGCCAACRAVLPWEDLAIDHCHDSGELRGVLCMGCNMALGQLRDDGERIHLLGTYLASHQFDLRDLCA
jgi:hypothetical protein